MDATMVAQPIIGLEVVFMRRGMLLHASLALMMLLALGCSDSDSSPTEPEPTINSVIIETITPARDTTLSAGSRVTFRARVSYTLATASSGRLSMIIQDQASRNISSTSPQPNAQVSRGGGVVELADTVTIPANGVTRVDVFVPLLPAGAASTNTVQIVSYPVR
jgi:hypothetical protein